MCQRILGGRKHGNGIVCNCCNREVKSPSQTDFVLLWVSAFDPSVFLSNFIATMFMCDQVSPSQFEAHAGMAARRQP